MKTLLGYVRNARMTLFAFVQYGLLTRILTTWWFVFIYISTSKIKSLLNYRIN